MDVVKEDMNEKGESERRRTQSIYLIPQKMSLVIGWSSMHLSSSFLKQFSFAAFIFFVTLSKFSF